MAPAPSAPSRTVFDSVLERVSSSQRPMPPPPAAELSAAEREILAQWFAQGLPRNDAQCTKGTARPPSNPGVSCPTDLAIQPASPYALASQSGDQYVCYGVDVTRSQPSHAVAFAPRIDNARVLHHALLFEASSSYPATPQPCSGGGSVTWKLITGWAPGTKGFELPPEAGFPLKTSGATHYVVQLHYSNPQGRPNEVDASGFDICTSAPRKFEADVLAFGIQQFTIPPTPRGAAPYSKTCRVNAKLVPSFPASPSLAGIRVIAAMPHMHTLGTAISTELLRGGSESNIVDLGTVPAWDFNTQAWIPLGDSGAGVTIQSGDVIRSRCSWNNTTGSNVRFGERTQDEMCYSFSVYYPKIKNLVAWALPATVASLTDQTCSSP